MTNYAVKFELESDVNEALCGGPWILAGQTLVVRRWSATFNPMTDRIGSMAVWVRVLGLPLLYFTDYAMSKVGKLLGEVVKVDQVTLSQERGRFGRVCVEIDLSCPFKSVVEVDGVSYKVQYEGLSMLCFSCGMYGHSKDKCPCNVPKDMESDDSGEVPVPVKEMHSDKAQDHNMEHMGSKVGTRKIEEEEGFGPWMLVNARGKKKSGKAGGTLPVQGSRFSSL